MTITAGQSVEIIDNAIDAKSSGEEPRWIPAEVVEVEADGHVLVFVPKYAAVNYAYRIVRRAFSEVRVA